MSPEIFRTKYYEICDQYQGFCKLYTDALVMALMGDKVSSANICGSTTKTIRLSNGVSFTEQSYMLSHLHLMLFIN